MNIAIFTNTLTPHVGGVARSVEAFTEEYRKRGHRVLQIAPAFADTPADEVDVFRLPAIQNFNASDFSVALPVPTGLNDRLTEFQPDIIHSQHPFLLGNTAVRVARSFQRPLVFTHHTLYEQYTHYVPGDSDLLKRFVIELATHYANLSDQVFAPSESIRDLLYDRGVTTPIDVVPTGIRPERFKHGDGRRFREQRDISEHAFVIGHLGRLAPEKNLEFLAEAVAKFVGSHHEAYFLVVGNGPSEPAIKKAFADAGIDARLQICGTLEREELADALNAMNLFAFSSQSETQGMVLIEAMAAGLPVLALDATGAREVVADRRNGRLLHDPSIEAFRDALEDMYAMTPAEMQKQISAARETAEAFSMSRSADTALACFERLMLQVAAHGPEEEKGWEQVMTRIRAEWEILKNLTRAGDSALGSENKQKRNG